MRRMLRIAGWFGLGLSALLFMATVVFWVRSLGHREEWNFNRFEPRPDWTAAVPAGLGIRHWWSAEAVHGRLWLRSETGALLREFKPRTQYRRDPISADEAKQQFDSSFQPGERRWHGGTQRAWRFAGAGFRQSRSAVDPWIGRPNYEALNLALPFWMLTVLFGLWPGVRLLRWLFKKKRYAAGLCPTCGYDLRATPERCPECGSLVADGSAGGRAK